MRRPRGPPSGGGDDGSALLGRSVDLLCLFHCLLGFLYPTYHGGGDSDRVYLYGAKYYPFLGPAGGPGPCHGVYNLASSGTRVLSGVFLGSVAVQLGVVRGLILLAGSIGVVILGTSTMVRSLWKSELDEGTGFETAEGVSAN